MDVKHSLTVATFFFSLPIFAATNSPTFVYQGRLLNASGTAPLSDNNLTLTFAIYDPSGNCLLYEETQSGIDTASTQGAFSLQVGSLTGSGKRTANDPQLEMSKIFANSGTVRAPGSPDCATGYSPAAGDVRKLRVTATPSAGGAITLSPDQTLTSVPQAVVADTLQGLEPMQFVQVTGNASSYQVGKTDLDLILGPSGAQDASSKHHHNSLYAKLSGSSTLTLSSGSLLGLGSRASDPIGLGVGDAGKTWFDSSAGAIKFFDGTSVKTLGLEGSGVQSLLAGVGISISGTANSTIALDAGTQTTLSSVAGKLDASLPVGQIFVGNGAGSAQAVSVSGDVSLSSAGAVTVNQVGGVTAANVASGANAANAAVSTNTGNTLVKRDPSGNFAAATITANSVTGLNAPANTSDAATKEYVDAAAGSGGMYQTTCSPMYGSSNAVICVRTNTTNGSTECNYSGNSGSTWSNCGTSPFGGATSPDMPMGYFVMTYSTYNGNLGGLSGANDKCLQELTAFPWKGKTDAENRGIVTAANIKAFLCDSSTCNAAEPFTQYMFSRVGLVNMGGGLFTTDVAGYGPMDVSGWSGSPQFSTSAEYWTGRGTGGTASNWTNSPNSSYTCSNWSTTSGNGQYGTNGNSDSGRWSVNNQGCNVAMRLICFVHP